MGGKQSRKIRQHQIGRLSGSEMSEKMRGSLPIIFSVYKPFNGHILEKLLQSNLDKCGRDRAADPRAVENPHINL